MKGKGSQTKPTTKSGDVDFDDNAQAEQDDQDEEQAHDESQQDDPEAYVIAAATSSSESDMESDGFWRNARLVRKRMQGLQSRYSNSGMSC